MKKYIALLIIALLACGCNCKRRLSQETNFLLTEERVSDSLVKDSSATEHISHAEQAHQVLEQLFEDIKANIVTERLDTAGRLIERTTAEVVVSKRQVRDEYEARATSDTSVTVNVRTEECRDTTYSSVALNMTEVDVLERSPNPGFMFMCVMIIAVIVYLCRRFFLF